KLSLLAAVSLLLATGCAPEMTGLAGGAASKPAVVFPSRTELAQLPSKKAPADAFTTQDVVVDAWTFESHAATSAAAPYDDPSALGQVVRDLAAAHAPRLTASNALRCAAEEIGRFHLQHNALPAESLRRFIVARCGGTTSQALAAASPFTMPE